MKKNSQNFMRRFNVMIATTIGLVWLSLGISCEKDGMTRSMEPDVEVLIIGDSAKVNDSVESEELPGISFNLESDSLEEEVEEIHFEAMDWDEEGMNVDL